MTRDGHQWLVLRPEIGGVYVAARSDSEFVRKHKKRGTVAGVQIALSGQPFGEKHRKSACQTSRGSER